MIEKELVPYEESSELRELGFTEKCFKRSEHKKKCEYKEQEGGCPLHNLHCGYPDCTIDKNILPVPLPTFSQAFRWFRENYGLCLVIKPIDDKKLDLGYNLTKNGLIMNAHLTYEEAELACIKELIKIVKNGK